MEMPLWIMQNKQVDFLKYLKALFARHFKPQTDVGWVQSA